MEAPHLPVVLTSFRTPEDVEFVQRTFATTVGPRERDLVVTRVTVGSPTGQPREGLLCAAVLPGERSEWGSPGRSLGEGSSGKPNGALEAQDQVAGLCSAVFAWPFRVAEGELLEIDVRLPVDEFSGHALSSATRPWPNGSWARTTR